MQLKDGAAGNNAANFPHALLSPSSASMCVCVRVCWVDYAMLRNMKTSKVIPSAGIAVAVAVEDDKQ